MELSYGKTLRLLRGNYSQKEFASKFGLSQSAYARYEAQESEPPFSFLFALSEEYHVSIDYILNGKGTIRLETYGDLLYTLEEVSKKFPITFYPGPVKIEISSSELENVFASWQTISDLVRRGDIDQELYDMWLQKRIDENATKNI